MSTYTSYYSRNKDKVKAKNGTYYENNKEKYQEYYSKNAEEKKAAQTEYRNTHIEEIAEAAKLYCKTEKGQRRNKTSSWKFKGITHTFESYNDLYDHYLTAKQCEEANCNMTLIDNSFTVNKRVLNYNYKTKEYRGIVCHTCNLKLNKIDRENEA